MQIIMEYQENENMTRTQELNLRITNLINYPVLINTITYYSEM